MIPTHEPYTYRVPQPDGGEAKLVRTWTHEQVEHIISCALDVVEKLEPPDDLRQAVFATALNLGGQMIHLQSGIAVASLSAIDGRQL